VKTIEAGLLTCGSPYSPTPSQPPDGQWLIQLAFVPAYSGASVRDLHPLPESMPSIANVRYQTQNYHLKQHMSSTVLPHQDGMSGGRDMAGPGAALPWPSRRHPRLCRRPLCASLSRFSMQYHLWWAKLLHLLQQSPSG
jgi:hypothetical protein